MYTMPVVDDIRGKRINTNRGNDGNDTMSSTRAVVDTTTVPVRPPGAPVPLKTISRIVDVSTLANFLRNFPLTNLTTDERRTFMAFHQFVVRMENQTFEEAGFE